MRLAIKNMVFSRCIMVVRQEFEKISLTPITVELGEVELREAPSDSEINRLRRELADKGFELLDDRKMMMVEKVKNITLMRFFVQMRQMSK